MRGMSEFKASVSGWGYDYENGSAGVPGPSAKEKESVEELISKICWESGRAKAKETYGHGTYFYDLLRIHQETIVCEAGRIYWLNFESLKTPTLRKEEDIKVIRLGSQSHNKTKAQ